MKISKKKILFILTFIISIAFIIIFSNIFLFNNKTQTMNDNNQKRTAFGSYILDSDNKRLMHPIKLSQPFFQGDFAAGGFFQDNATFDVTLLNNFNQIEFSIDGSPKSKIQRLNIKKNATDDFEFLKHRIKIENIKEGVNDLLLIFTQKYNMDELKFYKSMTGTHRSTFLTRFNITRGTLSNSSVKIDLNYGYKILKGNEYALQDVFIYDKLFDTFVNSKCPYNTINYINTSNSKIDFPLSINTETQIEGSALYNKYIEDEKLNKKEVIAVFLLLNGSLQPAYYDKDKKKSVYFCEKAFKDIIMIDPKVEISVKGLNTCTTIVVCYPFANSDIFSNTYNYTKWSSGIVSNEVFVENQ